MKTTASLHTCRFSGDPVPLMSLSPKKLETRDIFFRCLLLNSHVPPGSPKRLIHLLESLHSPQPPTRLSVWMGVPLRMTQSSSFSEVPSAQSHPCPARLKAQAVPRQPSLRCCRCCQAGPALNTASWLQLPRQEADESDNDSQTSRQQGQISKCDFFPLSSSH